MNTNNSKPGWLDRDIRNDILRPLATAVGGPVRAGLLTGTLLGVPYYLFARKNKRDYPLLEALGVGALSGLGAYGLLGGRLNKHGYKYPDTNAWVDRLLGPASKTSSDPFTLDRADLFDAVADLPGFNTPQKNFLALGVANSPGKDKVELPSLAEGFGNVTGAVTGGILPMATRAIEGALIGSAFGYLLGVTPKTRKWMTGIGAVADSLYGNRLIRAVGDL